MRRAIIALVRKTFGKNHSMRAQASVSTLMTCVGFVMVVICFMTSLLVYYSGSEPMPDYADHLIIVNMPDSMDEYLTSQNFYLNSQIKKKEWEAYYDIFTFTSWMEEEDAFMVMVFPEDFDELVLEQVPEEIPEILTYCSPDYLEYVEAQEELIDEMLTDGYLPYIQSNLEIPVKREEVPEQMISGMYTQSGRNVVRDRVSRMVMPLLFFVCIMYVCMLTGMNAIAGEKERGTFAAILMTPISRMTIVLGNYIGVLLHALIPCAVLLVPTIFLSKWYGLPGLLLLILSLAAFMAAITILISCLNQSISSAQTTFLPIFLIVLVACVTCMQSTTPNPVNNYIPIYGHFYGIGDCMMGTARVLPVIVTSMVTFLLAGVCILVSRRLLETEAFTVAVETKSERELRRAAKIAKKQEKDYVSISRANVFGYHAKKRRSLIKFLVGHAMLPLALLSLFQPIAMIPAIVSFMKSPESMSFIRMFRDISGVEGVSEVMNRSADLFAQFMQNKWFIFFMGLGYWVIIGLYVLLVRLREKNPLSTLGFPSAKSLKKDGKMTPWRSYVSGLGLGLLLIGSVYGLLLATGQVTCEGFALRTEHLPMFLLYILMWLPQGATEEIMMRGYMIPRVASRLGVPFAVFFSSMCFSLMHAGNAGYSWLALINLALIAALFACIALRNGNIYMVCAMHTVWNFCQGNVFGLEVSGNAGNASVLRSTTNASARDIMTGGGFGPEGGLCVTIVIVVAFAVLLLTHKRQPKAETVQAEAI